MRKVIFLTLLFSSVFTSSKAQQIDARWMVNGVPLGGYIDQAEVKDFLSDFFYYAAMASDSEQIGQPLLLSIATGVLQNGNLNKDYFPGASEKAIEKLQGQGFQEDLCNVAQLRTSSEMEVLVVVADPSVLGIKATKGCALYAVALSLNIDVGRLIGQDSDSLFRILLTELKDIKDR